MDRRKGICCLEAAGAGKRGKSSVEPVLHLLETAPNLRVPYQRMEVATSEELEFRLKEWSGPGFADYPILYLAFDGRPGQIELGSGGSEFGLREMETALKGACTGRIVHFGSSATLELHGNSLNRFLHRTGTVALMSYGSNADWLSSSAFDVLLLGRLQETPFTSRGMRKLDGILNETALRLRRTVAFDLHYDRKRAREGR